MGLSRRQSTKEFKSKRNVLFRRLGRIRVGGLQF